MEEGLKKRSNLELVVDGLAFWAWRSHLADRMVKNSLLWIYLQNFGRLKHLDRDEQVVQLDSQ